MTQISLAANQTERVLVDIAVPVYNEEADLESSVRRLHEYLVNSFPIGAAITIVDNASTDSTWPVATRLEDELSGVRALHLDQKGRGHALRAAWSRSEADIVAYMDVDLSTDLDALLPLVAPLISGHSDVAIGSRLARGARVIRGPKREVISRGYNALLRLALRSRFTDAQCGFKALRRGTATALLPVVADNEWFFDTELLVAAERRGLRIHEVPVDWNDDPDSRVDIVKTALADLRGVWRLRTHHAVDPADVMATHRKFDGLPDLGRSLGATSLWPLTGLAAYLAAFGLLAGAIGVYPANIIGLVVSTPFSLAPILRAARPLRRLLEVSAVRVVGCALVTSGCLVFARLVSTRLVPQLMALAVGAAATSLVRFVYLDALIYRRHIAMRSLTTIGARDLEISDRAHVTLPKRRVS